QTSSGDLVLASNVSAGAGTNNAALVASGNLTEMGGAVTASGLIVNSGGAVTLDSPNAVTTLSGASIGAFRFVNGSTLTVGSVPAVLDVASQSGIATEGVVRIRANTGDVVLASGLGAGVCPSAITTCDAPLPPQPAAVVATAGNVTETTGFVTASDL